ncbi:MAG: hypothetical protein QNJ94_01235 [Alphaproteobacteria bacterium]|nr:hypothetical protein [Alphaproteobacteria bacterium]
MSTASVGERRIAYNWRGLFFWLLILFLNAALLELLAFGFAKLNHDLFRADPAVISAELAPDAYARFLSIRYHPVKGWQNRLHTSYTGKSCLGEETSFNFDRNGARISHPVMQPLIMTIGDSYTVGAQANDDQSYPSQLEVILGKEVVNYGIGAAGPLQAVLQFEEQIDKHPTVRTAILGIMYENIMRMANAYRPALIRRSKMPFGFKPFVKVENGVARHVSNPNAAPLQPGEELRDAALSAMDQDYWYKPRERFPYIVSVARVLANKKPRQMFTERVNTLIGRPQFGQYYKEPDLYLGLQSVVTRFANAAKKRGVRPLVLFLPQNRLDRSSPSEFIADMESELSGVDFIDMGRAEIDWGRYNDKTPCHPSPYGYRMIAEYVAQHF